MTRVLILGGSGFVGSNLVRYFARRCDLRFTYLTSTRPAIVDSLAAVRLDIRDARAVLSTFRDLASDVVIHAAGNKNVQQCERHPEEAFATNAMGTRNVALACREIGARLIYLSTDLVFSGDSGDYHEDDTPEPTSVYGHSKLQGERLALDLLPAAVICRSGGIYGRSSPLLAWAAAELAAGRHLEAFTDVYNTPTYAGNLGEMLEAVIREGIGRVFHTVGCSRVNRFQLFAAFAKEFGLRVDLVRAVAAGERRRGLLLNPDVSLSSIATAAHLRMPFNSLAKGLERMRREGGLQ
jgi:dTDP-4-dehydrorhamnose reductase